MRFDILSIFPEMFESVIGCSIQKRAIDSGILSYHFHDIRKWSTLKHKNTDDYPFGGGNGLVMLAQPIFDCISDVTKQDDEKPYCIMMTPRGRMLTTEVARELSTKKRILLLCGHYEGIDERVMELMDDEISTGDYVLTGGELPAMVLCDCISRFIPGVLGTSESAEDESFSVYGGLLEYPQYSRPASFNGMEVPEVLLKGNHAEIVKWRRRQSIIKTAQNRPDLIETANLTDSELCLAQRFMKALASDEIQRIEFTEKRSIQVFVSKPYLDINSHYPDIHWNNTGYLFITRVKKPVDAIIRIITAVQLKCDTILSVTDNTEFINLKDSQINQITQGDLI